ncbi:MAG: bis(5'-nucleosyl)-tetraphosphatase (symmetrical), partial [Nitrospirae bacterium]
IPPAIPRAETIIFGHWSALGIVLGEKHWGLDGGCVWGKSLAAVRIEDRHLITVSCRKHRR